MAIIALGHSRCTLCGKTLNEGDDIQGFPVLPSFPVDENGELCEIEEEWCRFSDSGVHRGCFDIWPEKKEFLRVYGSFIRTE